MLDYHKDSEKKDEEVKVIKCTLEEKNARISESIRELEESQKTIHFL